MVISSWRSGGWMDVDSLIFVCLFVCGGCTRYQALHSYLHIRHTYIFIYLLFRSLIHGLSG